MWMIKISHCSGISSVSNLLMAFTSRFYYSFSYIKRKVYTVTLFFSPGRRQAVIWTNSGILLIGTLGTNFSEIVSEIHTFSCMKMRLKNVVCEMEAILSQPPCVNVMAWISNQHTSDACYTSAHDITISFSRLTRFNPCHMCAFGGSRGKSCGMEIDGLFRNKCLVQRWAGSCI